MIPEQEFPVYLITKWAMPLPLESGSKCASCWLGAATRQTAAFYVYSFVEATPRYKLGDNPLMKRRRDDWEAVLLQAHEQQRGIFEPVHIAAYCIACLAREFIPYMGYPGRHDIDVLEEMLCESHSPALAVISYMGLCAHDDRYVTFNAVTCDNLPICELWQDLNQQEALEKLCTSSTTDEIGFDSEALQMGHSIMRDKFAATT